MPRVTRIPITPGARHGTPETYGAAQQTPGMANEETVLRVTIGEWLLGGGDPPPKLELSVTSSKGTVEIIGATEARPGDYKLVRCADDNHRESNSGE